MNEKKTPWYRNWYILLILLFFAGAGGMYICSGEDVQIAVHDNLDLFQAQYQMLKNTGTFFAHHAAAPFLGGLTRDDLPSELSFAGILYWLLPSLQAYLVLYFSKILMAVISFTLLAGELFGTCPAGKRRPVLKGKEKALAVLTGFGYGILNLFPAFGICFASIPLAVWLFIRLYRAGSRKESALCALGIFIYPFFSYFSYFGLFLCCYVLAAVIWISLRDKRFAGRLFLGLVLLSLGYVCFEYRLFGQMLLSDTVSIRESFVAGNLTGGEILAEIADVWKNGMMHAEDVHQKLVLPVCVLFFLLQNGWYLVRRQGKRIFRDLYNLVMLLLVFNSVVYGLYNLEPFRGLIETILPPLKGWQFNRTVFFNPFLWYSAFLMVCLRLQKLSGGQTGKEKAGRGPAKKAVSLLPEVLALGAIVVILLSPTRYNDLYSTAHAKAAELLRGQKIDTLSYGEFYSTALFDKIKEDLDYQAGDFAHSSDAQTIHLTAVAGGERKALTDSAGAQWAVAYGLHPAVLEYNGIATLDGYLGFYAQSYKEAFREVIAPALEKREATRIYYDEWGARCYLYSGDEDTIVQAVRNYQPQSQVLTADTDALRNLGCRYIFSRICLSNADEKNLTLRGTYTDASSPYTIYVYEVD